MSNSQKGTAPLTVLISSVFVLGFLAFLAGEQFNKFSAKQMVHAQTPTTWAFEETFDYGAPTAPSQPLLPKNFDYTVTHRSHPDTPDGLNSNGSYGTFPADHDEDCTFDGTNAMQHTVSTDHRNNSLNPDQSFYICNNHMMSSMGEVEGYSVTTFWPRQEFDFASGGTLEWDVNLNTQSRNWYEVVIMPRNQFHIAPAIASLPIDENYPKDRIVLRFGSPDGGERLIAVSNQAPSGGEDNDRNRSNEWNTWKNAYPSDPANTDRRIRRKNRLTIENNRLTWGIQKQDGTFDNAVLDVPQGLPFTRGLVEFKTHAYTPDKDEIHHRHTFHWDNIRFSGPKLIPYQSFETNDVVTLNGVGSTKTQTLNLTRIGANPVLMGQIHFSIKGALKLSINGNPDINIYPSIFDSTTRCFVDGWGTYWKTINPAQLKVGANTLKWTYAQEPSCSSAWWHNYTSIKDTEIQMDVSTTEVSPTPSITPSIAPSPSVVKPGDIDGNGRVDIFDYNTLLTNFNKTGTNVQGDLNNSGKVDIFDYNILLTNFGK